MSLFNQSSLNQVNSLANAFGLNAWQIQDSSWNGYKFATVSSGLLSKLSSGLGPISSVISATENIIDSTEQAFGIANTDSIPGGANMQSTNVTDTFVRKIAINSLPNGRDNIRGLGYNGQDIVMYALDWGPSYLTGLKNNLINMFYSDEVLSPSNKNYHILQHPFLGRMTDVWLLSMRVVHRATTWRACVYELRFRSEIPIGVQSTKRSLAQILNDSISAILSVASSINSLWSTLQFVFQGNLQLKQLNNNVIVQNQIQKIQAPTLAASNNAVSAVKILTSTLAPANYNNVSLNKYVTTTPTISQLSYFQSHFTPQDINNLMDILTANINEAINAVYQYGDNYYYGTITLLQSLISYSSAYASILLENYYGQVQQYRIPYDMSLFVACQLNNVDYESNYKKIVALNQGKFFWLNKLVKGDLITLPIGNA